MQTLDSVAARRWAVAALGALGEAREEIDTLNVFPVPDGDTGTNMYLTLEAAVMAAAAVPDDAPVAELADAFARGALMGARGNSGIIGAQLLRGWADTLSEYTLLSAASAVEGFRRADEQAWLAVNEPVEGTMLSVSRAAADAARTAAAVADPTLQHVVVAAAEAARHALELTPSQLPALARAGVVDAGGRGLVVLIDSLVELVQGASPRRPSRTHRHPALPAVDYGCPQAMDGGRAADGGPALERGPALDGGPAASGGRVAGEDAVRAADVSGPGYQGPAYEVMFLLDTATPAVDMVPGAAAGVDDGLGAAAGTNDGLGQLRRRLAELGDSLVIVGGGGLWQVHVHLDDPGAAIEAAIEFGRPHRIRISHFADHGGLSHARKPGTAGSGRSGSFGGELSGLRGITGLGGLGGVGGLGGAMVACAAGPGLVELFESAGAVVVEAGPGRRPSTGQLLGAVRRTGAASVVLLPNDRDTLNVAQVAAAAAREDGVRVTVVPTTAQVQGLAAAAVHDPARRYEDDVVAMSSAAGAARDGAVTVAARDGLTSAGPCRAGDALGVVDGDFAVIGSDLRAVGIDVVERLLSGGGELVTLVVGAGGHESLARSVQTHLHNAHRQLEVSVLDGGQPRYPLLIGVE